MVRSGFKLWFVSMIVAVLGQSANPQHVNLNVISSTEPYFEYVTGLEEGTRFVVGATLSGKTLIRDRVASRTFGPFSQTSSFCARSMQVATANESHVSIRELKSDTVIANTPVPSVRNLMYSEDGTRLIGLTPDSVKIWDNSLREVASVPMPHYVARKIAVSPDSQKLAVAESSGAVSLYNITTGDLLGLIFSGFDSDQIGFSADSRQLITTFFEGSCNSTDLTTFAEVSRFSIPAGAKYLNGAKKEVFVVTATNSIQVFSTEDGTLRGTIPGGSRAFSSIVASRDGSHFCVNEVFDYANSNNDLYTSSLYSSDTLQKLPSIHPTKPGLIDYSASPFSPTGNYCLTTVGEFARTVYDVNSGKVFGLLAGNIPSDPGRFNADETALLHNDSNSLKLYDFRNGMYIRTLATEPVVIQSAAYTDSFRKIIYSTGSQVVVLDAVSGSELRRLVLNTPLSAKIALSQSGKYMYAFTDTRIQVYDFQLGTYLYARAPLSRLRRIYSDAQSPYWFTMQDGGTVVRDLATGNILGGLNYPGSLTGLDFLHPTLPDILTGTLNAVESYDRTTQQRLYSLPIIGNFRGASSNHQIVAVDHNDRTEFIANPIHIPGTNVKLVFEGHSNLSPSPTVTIATRVVGSQSESIQTRKVQSNTYAFLRTSTTGSHQARITSTGYLSRLVGFDARREFTEQTILMHSGDIVPDNVIDLSDYSQLAVAFGSQSTSVNWNSKCDLNFDQVVDLTDYTILATNFGMMGE
jgi:WD40 repeat protein